jgi:penicillin-binding protein 1C
VTRRLSLSAALRRIAAIGAIGLIALKVWPHEPLRASVPLSTAVWSADGELLRVTLSADEQYRLWVPLDQISPALVDAVLLKEDR